MVLYNLGRAYELGECVLQDWAKAVHFYRLAAEQGHAAAQFSLGLSFIRGIGVGEASPRLQLGITLIYEDGAEVEDLVHAGTEPLIEVLGVQPPWTDEVGKGLLQDNGGTGLGLLITRQLLALHAGSTLRLCSCGPGTGTTFKMQLNLERALHEAATDQPAGARRASAAQLALVAVAAAAHASADVAPGRAARMPPGFRCLYVDDDAFLQLTLPPRLFDPHAIEYDCASDGEEALRLVLEEGRRYDLILIDSQMPRMNGTLCVRALRAAGFAGAIIGMTGDPLGCPEREEFDAAGLSKSLSKDSGGIVAVLKTLADIADDYNASACTRL